LSFRDENGDSVVLGELFQSGLPVILTFNYSNCPVLCSLQLGGLVETLRELSWSAGQQFHIITIGIDPDEKPERTREVKAQYLERYERNTAAEGWRFLAGSEVAVEALAEAVGYRYRLVPERNE